MSVDISVSNNKNSGCKEIISSLLKANINARTIETTSVIDRNIEKGCLITLSKDYYDKKNYLIFGKY
tara:strand:- start:193 stop:393 length:201 start_codon:yes stop_codon:yes gene_type:complete